ncbi:MAG: molybdenum ABC transporter ATP-binding protein, partial [Pseudomonadota bacterium]
LALTLQHPLPEFALDLDTTLALSGPTALFGPSGSGKSTVLRAIAGLLTPEHGRIVFGETCWFDDAESINLAPHARAVTLLLQQPGLFPHTTVTGNLDLAERFSASRRSNNLMPRDQVIEALDLSPLLSRRPETLSGGEQRRVALARALLASPALLLLDEPLTGLDAARKREILPYLKEALRAFNRPALLVSHDIGEVAELCADMVVMDAGRVRLTGRKDTLIGDLALTPYTGRFEAGVLIEGTLAQHYEHRHLSEVALPGTNERLSMPLASTVAIGGRIALRVRARDVAVATQPPQGLSIRNVLAGTLTALTPEPEPGFVDARITVGTVDLRARLTTAAVEDLALQAGQPIYALVKSVSFDLG